MVNIISKDKYNLKGEIFYSNKENKKNKLLIINFATGCKCIEKIGHFGFFSRKFESTLWDKTVNWYINT